MIKLENCNQINEEHVGMYARFEGHGIFDGFAIPACKFDAHLVKAVDNSGIYVGSYHKHHNGVVSPCNFNQAVELYTPEEFKKLPVYS